MVGPQSHLHGYTEMLCDRLPGDGIPGSRVSGGCQTYRPIHRMWRAYGVVELKCGHLVPATNPRRRVTFTVRQEAA